MYIVPLRGLSKKPSPIVVDHVLTNIVFPLLALLLGMPVMSGVPIRTIANMVALAKMEPHPAPGKPPKVLYLVETRVNTLIVGILVTVSVFLGDILQYIPVAALMGLFLFLGIFGLKGLHFRKLLTAMFSRTKYWSEWNVLDGMPRPQVIVFTVIWIVELIILCTLLVFGEYDNLMVASTAIPFFLVFCGVFRNKILPHWKWIAPYLEKIDPSCAPEARVKSS
ncbi:Anion exchange protein 3 [Sparganum proliferum]